MNKIIIFITFIFLLTDSFGQKQKIQKLDNVLSPQASASAFAKFTGLNKTLLEISGQIDNNGEEFGVMDFKPATNDPNELDSVKNRLWKDPNETLLYGGDFQALGSINASSNITANNFTASSKITADSFRLITGAGIGKVLTSIDANGNAEWQTLSGGGSGSINGLSDGKSLTGSNSVFLGSGAGANDNSTSNKANVALGINSMLNTNATNGRYNTAIGFESMKGFVSGEKNTAIGYQSLFANTSTSATGDENTAIGYQALMDNISGTGNVAIGFQAGRDELGSDKLYIHNAASTNPLIWGDFNLADLKINGSLEVTQGITGTVSPSDLRYKRNIKTISNVLLNVIKLRGVSYDWESEKFPHKRFNKRKQIGLIAQEVEEVYPELVETFDDGFKGVDYSKMSAVLIQAIKEQQKIIDEQNSKINSQEERLSKIESLLHEKRFTSIKK
jgi:hypothetical protein